ncbi:MAG: FKBP-type peptidyl-prolyl cis-trans isomerase [Actinomycetota bacterium]
MGTAKRERQKANRQLRLEELAKEARKEKSKRWVLRIGLLVVGVVALVGIVYLIGGGSNSSSTTTTTIPGTVVGTTTTTPPKPTVKPPATAPTKLVVTTITKGTGPAAKSGDTISVHYIGVLQKDGSVFDNSYDRKQPIPVQLGAGQVITGWDQGLIGTQAGGRYQLDIPSDLAYGAAGHAPIGPNESLTFVVDVMSITPAPAPSGASTSAAVTAAAVTTAAVTTKS